MDVCAERHPPATPPGGDLRRAEHHPLRGTCLVHKSVPEVQHAAGRLLTLSRPLCTVSGSLASSHAAVCDHSCQLAHGTGRPADDMLCQARRQNFLEKLWQPYVPVLVQRCNKGQQMLSVVVAAAGGRSVRRRKAARRADNSKSMGVTYHIRLHVFKQELLSAEWSCKAQGAWACLPSRRQVSNSIATASLHI